MSLNGLERQASQLETPTESVTGLNPIYAERGKKGAFRLNDEGREKVQECWKFLKDQMTPNLDWEQKMQIVGTFVATVKDDASQEKDLSPFVNLMEKSLQMRLINARNKEELKEMKEPVSPWSGVIGAFEEEGMATNRLPQLRKTILSKVEERVADKSALNYHQVAIEGEVTRAIEEFVRDDYHNNATPDQRKSMTTGGLTNLAWNAIQKSYNLTAEEYFANGTQDPDTTDKISTPQVNKIKDPRTVTTRSEPQRRRITGRALVSGLSALAVVAAALPSDKKPDDVRSKDRDHNSGMNRGVLYTANGLGHKTLAGSQSNNLIDTNGVSSGIRSSNGSENLTSYPASDYEMNKPGDERTGVNLVTVESFRKYWLDMTNANDYSEMAKLDRMFGQLSLPVKDLSDRDLNFDWRNQGQGLGFTTDDLSELRTDQELLADQWKSRNDAISPISRKGEDGNFRTWTITNARNFENVVLANVDESLRIKGIINPVTDQGVQGQRKALFNKIVYGDLGVNEDHPDRNWQSVDDKFESCVSYSENASKRADQPENVSGVVYDPNVEISGNGKEDETFDDRDSDNNLLVAVVISPDGKIRVETYDLSNPPDLLDPSLNPDGEGVEGGRVFGGRFTPFCDSEGNPLSTIALPIAETPQQETTPTKESTPTVTPTRRPTVIPTVTTTPTPNVTPTPKAPCNNGVGNGPDCPPPGHDKNHDGIADDPKGDNDDDQSNRDCGDPGNPCNNQGGGNENNPSGNTDGNLPPGQEKKDNDRDRGNGNN